MTIKLVLMLMLASGGIAHVVDVKGAFLHSKFDDGEKIYIKIPLGFEEFYDNNTVLLLKKCLYDLNKQQWHFTGRFLLQQPKLDSRAVLLIHASITNGKGEDRSL
jgi:hypothetical protein